MCGRFYLDADTEFLLNYYHIKYEPKVKTEQHIFYPTQAAPVIIEVGGDRRLGTMQWGFGGKPPLFNSRAETIHAKVTFKDAFEKRRCIIPATGFYEWSEKTDTKKDPKKKDRYKIEMPNQEIMHMAGIYTKTTDESGQLKWQFSVVTREANADMGIIHHRMPLMLSVNDLSTWMDSQTPLSDLKELLNFDIGHLNVILDEPQIHIDTLL